MLELLSLLTLVFAQESPYSAPLPAGVDASKKWKLVRDADGKEVPAQILSDRILWIDDAPRKYRLQSGAPADFPRVDCDAAEGSLGLKVAGRNVLRYNAAVLRAPPGVDAAHERSGYIHPVWTPSGRAISNDFPRGHEHHHGIWFAWRTGEFEGRKLNAFAPLEKLGRVEFVKIEDTYSGPVSGGFRARHKFVDVNAPGGPRTALDELWDARVYAVEKAFVFDLEVTQSCAGESSYLVLKNYYGGLGFRGSLEWEGKGGVAFLTSEGKTRLDGNGLPARWVAMNGKIGGKDAGIGHFCHPSNVRAPQRTRLNPSEPFFCWVPGADSELRIEPGKPFVSRYRYLVADHALGAEEMERHWAAFAEPSKDAVISVLR